MHNFRVSLHYSTTSKNNHQSHANWPQRLSSEIHFIIGLIVCFRYSQFINKLLFDWLLCERQYHTIGTATACKRDFSRRHLNAIKEGGGWIPSTHSIPMLSSSSWINTYKYPQRMYLLNLSNKHSTLLCKVNM